MVSRFTKRTSPLPAAADVVFLPSTPFAYGVLQGVESWKGRIGFGCRVVIATGNCTSSPVDVILVPIANSTGEAQVFVQYIDITSGGSSELASESVEGVTLDPGPSISQAAGTGAVLLETFVSRFTPKSAVVSDPD